MPNKKREVLQCRKTVITQDDVSTQEKHLWTSFDIKDRWFERGVRKLKQGHVNNPSLNRGGDLRHNFYHTEIPYCPIKSCNDLL